MTHEQQVVFVFTRATEVLRLTGFTLRPMIERQGVVKDTRRGYTVGRTNLKTKSITIDIYTAKKREPKKPSAILRVLAHEVAHHQKQPYRQFYKGRWINRIHFPVFYRQVKRNVEKLKKDKILSRYFDD